MTYIEFIRADPVVVWELHIKFNIQVPFFKWITVLWHPLPSNNSDRACKRNIAFTYCTDLYSHAVVSSSTCKTSTEIKFLPGSMTLPAAYLTTICLPSKCFNVNWNPQSASTRPILWVMCRSCAALLYVCWHEKTGSVNIVIEVVFGQFKMTNICWKCNKLYHRTNRYCWQIKIIAPGSCAYTPCQSIVSPPH